mmetsp:Transcript_20459/g.64999  ORF Transcript_20459/g.64999 Transcript_20459/m.64999 type:complete len:208 (+) Transcript_20459:1692-2315(+)
MADGLEHTAAGVGSSEVSFFRVLGEDGPVTVYDAHSDRRVDVALRSVFSVFEATLSAACDKRRGHHTCELGGLRQREVERFLRPLEDDIKELEEPHQLFNAQEHAAARLTEARDAEDFGNLILERQCRALEMDGAEVGEELDCGERARCGRRNPHETVHLDVDVCPCVRVGLKVYELLECVNRHERRQVSLRRVCGRGNHLPRRAVD